MNKKRKLINNSEAIELDEPVALVIFTLSPEKWKIQDMETGEFYFGSIDSHPIYENELRSKVKNAKIVQWKKV